MLIMQKSAKKLLFFSTLAFSVPLALYILTLEPGLVGGDTSWYALQLPQMQVMVPTGYPAFSILGKIMSAIPAGDLAYRLNLFSAIFGALTILFLFLAINLLVKNEAISLAASLTFGFTMAFWTVANRLELDTLNSFFIALLLYSIFLYSEKRGRKHLYFCFASLGFSLTNHPIAFFIMPGFLLYVITVNLKIFKSLKAVLFSILYFLLPLSFYAWLPLRSIQGYGGVKTLRDFIMYVTGRNLSGEIHGGSFGDKTFADFLNSSKQFFAIIYENLGIILLIIAAAGLYALLKKNIRFAACSVLVILLNLVIVFLYLGWTPQNYVIDTLLIIALYIAAGLMFIFENIRKLTDKKISAGSFSESDAEIKNRKIKLLKNAVAVTLLAAFLLSPVLMAVRNYNQADASEVEGIYQFWNKIYSTVEDNSSIYAFSASANIGLFINKYEKPDKNIKFVNENEPSYSVESIKNDLKEGRNVYLAGLKESFASELNLELAASYRWTRFGENIMFYKVTGEKFKLEIKPEIKSGSVEFGKSFEVKYRIINSNAADITVSSIELEIPGNLKFEGVLPESSIKDEPGISRGKYMWVKNYNIKAGGQLDITIVLRAQVPGNAAIKFAVTSQDYCFNAEDLNISVIK